MWVPLYVYNYLTFHTSCIPIRLLLFISCFPLTDTLPVDTTVTAATGGSQLDDAARPLLHFCYLIRSLWHQRHLTHQLTPYIPLLCIQQSVVRYKRYRTSSNVPRFAFYL